MSGKTQAMVSTILDRYRAFDTTKEHVVCAECGQPVMRVIICTSQNQWLNGAMGFVYPTTDHFFGSREEIIVDVCECKVKEIKAWISKQLTT